MNKLNLVVILWLCLGYAIKNAASHSLNENINQNGTTEEYRITSQNGTNFDFLPAKVDCETLVIFDFSRLVMPKNMFDISIKKFLQLVMEYCNSLSYVTMSESLNNIDKYATDHPVTIHKCESSIECEINILNMDYISTTSTYSADLVDNNSNNTYNFERFLNETFSQISPCKENFVLLLTNRIVSNISNPEIIQLIASSNIKMTTILLGKNDTNAANLLQTVYKNLPNVTTLNLPNYDCLSYLFYCILPCSSNKPECMQEDIDDCQTLTASPNNNPKKTLHIWYVMNFAWPKKDPNNDANILANIFNMRKGLKEHLDNHDIKRVRIRYVTMDKNNVNHVSKSSEDVDSIYDLDYYFYFFKDSVVDDDDNVTNERLSLIPWSQTLLQTRIGISSVNIFTNYATKSLKTFINGQSLQGSLFIYDQLAYNYYSGTFENDKNLNAFYLGINDSVPVYSIQNDDPLPTMIPTDAPSACSSINKCNKKISGSKTKECETLIIFDLSKLSMTKDIFDNSVKNFMKLLLEYCNGFKYVIIGDSLNSDCEGPNDCNITINNCGDSNGCKNIIDNMDYKSMTSSYPFDVFEGSSETTKNYLKFLKKVFAEICPCQKNPVFLLTNRIISIHGDLEFAQTIKESCITLTPILLGKDSLNGAELLELVYKNILNVKPLNLPNSDCLADLFYCLIPCSNYAQECMEADVDGCQNLIETPNYHPDETLHLWCVFAFNSPFTEDSYYLVLDNFIKGVKDFVKTNYVEQVRIRVVTYDNYFVSYDNIDLLNNLYIWQVQENGFIIDDTNEMNERLSYIPWSGTLTPLRQGTLSVIILTNYASNQLKTFVNGQSLQGSWYIYNQQAFEYYSQILQNNTNFQLILSDYSDPIFVKPIINAGPATETFPPTTIASTPTSTPTSLSTYLPSLSSTLPTQNSDTLSTSLPSTTMKSSATLSVTDKTYITICATFFSFIFH